jgi:hypothetical protein
MKTKTLPLENSMNRSHCPLRLLLILLALACFVLAPQAQATCQEGCDTDHLNTFLGEDALINNTTGIDNSAIGFHALYSNTEGATNTAIGGIALYSNTTGINNTAIGYNVLFHNTTGNNNTANGLSALFRNAIGYGNTATGYQALVNNRTGYHNTATGYNALVSNTIGNNNIGLGVNAGASVLSGSGNIDIGNNGADESSTIRIGAAQTNTYIAGVSGARVPTGVAVIVDADGHLGTSTSSARFKDAIKPMDKASEAILSLQPVTFRYKKELDRSGIPQFGLVAEDVEKVNPALVARDERGKPYTVRYEAVNAMLLNEFLKEHRKVEQLTRDFESKLAEQQKQIEQLTAGLQKVSAQLELSKSAPQAVLNDQ